MKRFVPFISCYDDRIEVTEIDYVACVKDKKCIHIVVGKPDGERPLGRPENRWEHCGK
jgi:hypothetical protein